MAKVQLMKREANSEIEHSLQSIAITFRSKNQDSPLLFDIKNTYLI